MYSDALKSKSNFASDEIMVQCTLLQHGIRHGDSPIHVLWTSYVPGTHQPSTLSFPSLKKKVMAGRALLGLSAVGEGGFHSRRLKRENWFGM